MCLSKEALYGLRMTGVCSMASESHSFTRLSLLFVIHFHLVHAFVEMAKYLFRQPGVKCLLSERLSQDPLESFFGKHRGCGGRSNNPMASCSWLLSTRSSEGQLPQEKTGYTVY